MRYLYLYLIAMLLGLSVGLFAQADHFRVSVGGGPTAFMEANRGTGLAGALTLNYHVVIGEKTSFFFGAGLQYGAIQSASASGDPVPCNFPLGLKVATFFQSETYTTHSLLYTNQLGLERRLGKFALQLSFLPSYRLRDRIDYSEIISFDRTGLPDQRSEISIKPGERIADDATEWTIDYSTKFHIQGGVEATYQLADRLAIGLGYRRGLTEYRLVNKTVSVCGVAGCEEVDFERSSFDIRSGSGFLMMRFKL